jgi:glucan phosphoethanolaminetransferase (alkaline phosphatase superfamily)
LRYNKKKYIGTVKIKEKETYVLAIGESLRYGNLSIAGYNRNTTPLLDTTQNVILYNNYYSTANLTMYSVPQIITRATPLNFELSYKEKSIFKIRGISCN